MPHLKIVLAGPPKVFVRSHTHSVFLKCASQHGKERNTFYVSDDWALLPQTTLHFIAQFTINSSPPPPHRAAKRAYLMSTTPDSMNGSCVIIWGFMRPALSWILRVNMLCWPLFSGGTECSKWCKIHFAKSGLSVNSSESTKVHPLLLLVPVSVITVSC